MARTMKDTPVLTIALVATTAALSYIYHQYQMRKTTELLEKRRLEERTGRIRAEVKLRNIVKSEQNKEGLQIQVIGTVKSPFTKRMGTPRQPQLVPAARGIIEFTVPPASLEGMTEYSHAWIIFGFHANTNVENRRTKIRPPRAPHKVGQLSTRSPHRPNAIGLSLVCIDKLDKTKLYISGLDLVNNTPVYDIKPCVPWDIPETTLKTPTWVSQEDALSAVSFSPPALEALQRMINQDRLAPFYDNIEDARITLEEILAQDPRSSHKGLKSNQRGTESNEDYSIIFAKTKVSFHVKDGIVQVTDVEAIDFDPESYVEGIPIISSLNTAEE